MVSCMLLALSVCVAAQSASAPVHTPPVQRSAARIQDVALSVFPPGVTVNQVPTGTLFPGIRTQTTLWHLTFSDPAGTGYDEEFLLQVPPASAFPAPMVVAFHKYGVSVKDIPINTTFPQECEQRDWFLLAPLGASQISYSSEPCQRNTEFVLETVTSLSAGKIDPTRIYGVGFSMGGGVALNYAARHLDPLRPMFAALYNHTGSVSLVDTYTQSPPSQPVLEFWFGGPPWSSGLIYQRASLLDFDPVTEVVDVDTDLTRNLTHIPVRSMYVTFDPVQYLKEQTEIFHSHLRSLGGASELTVKSGVGHSWSNINETEVCDWFAQQSLVLPTAGETLADRDARYHHFVVRQESSTTFTPFKWKGDRGLNRLELSETANLLRLEVYTSSLDLDTAAPLEVTLATADGLADEVLLTGYALPPTTVLRDGVPSAAWSHFPLLGALLLLETDGTVSHTWQVTP